MGYTYVFVFSLSGVLFTRQYPQLNEFITSYHKDESFGKSLSTKHRTKSLTHQTGNYPVTCFVQDRLELPWLTSIHSKNETVKHEKMREEPENRMLLHTGDVCPCFRHLLLFLLDFVPHTWQYCFQGCALAVKGGGITASPLFQQADVGKIPATVKH